jgi:hypothetical protein
LAALALPIASIILTLQVLTKRDGEPPTSDGSVVLEDVLRGIADEKLSPDELKNGEARIELVVFDVSEERGRVEALLKSVGGIAIPTSESESEIRLLVRVPADRLAEFLAACLGEASRPSVGDLFEIVIKKRKAQ